MRFTALSGLALSAALATTAPAYAFDDLLRGIGVIPAVTNDYLAFEYVSPSRGFNVVDAMSVGVSGDETLNMALLAGEEDEVTGIDFGQVKSVLMLGSAPALTTVIFGAPGFATKAHEALLARDFTATERGDLTIYALGEDFALDFAAATSDPTDPLGSGTGKSQRLAIAEDHIIRTASWPEIGLAVATLESPPAYTQVWTDTILGMRTVAGEYANLEMASAWSMSAFGDVGQVFTTDDLPPPGGKIKLTTPELEPALAFPFAIMGITLDDETAGLHIAIPYGNEAMAAEAGEIITARLADFAAENVPAFEFTVVPAGDTPDAANVLVVSVETTSPERTEVQALYYSFVSAIYRRDFKPLMSGV